MPNRAYSVMVTAPAAFPAASVPDITLPFSPSSFILENRDTTAANYVEYSFDGVTVHGRLTPGGLGAIKYEKIRTRKIWLRRGAGTPSVQLIAEG